MQVEPQGVVGIDHSHAVAVVVDVKVVLLISCFNDDLEELLVVLVVVQGRVVVPVVVNSVVV